MPLGTLVTDTIVDGAVHMAEDQLMSRLAFWDLVSLDELLQVLWRPFTPKAWTSVPAVLRFCCGVCFLLCLILTFQRPLSFNLKASILAVMRLSVCWLPAFSLVVHHMGPLSRLLMVAVGDRPHLIATNCALWMLTSLQHRMLWMDALCMVCLGLATMGSYGGNPCVAGAACPPLQPQKPFVQVLTAAILGTLLPPVLWWLWQLSHRGRPLGWFSNVAVQQQQPRIRNAVLRPPGDARATFGTRKEGLLAQQKPQPAAYGVIPGASSVTRGGYAEAVRAALSRDTTSYHQAVQIAQVHLRLVGLQPEQLKPGWLSELEERLLCQGMCLLNAAVCRGSIFVSLTLASLRGSHVAPAAGGESRRWDSASEAPGPVARNTSASPADAGLLADPERLLSGLGMRHSELPEGFAFTVQAITDDGRIQRASYVLQQDGAWAEASGQEGPHRPGSHTSIADASSACSGASAGVPAWAIDAPLVVTGTLDPTGRKALRRYEMEAWVGLPNGSSEAGSPNTSGVMAPDKGLEFRVRPLNLSGAGGEFRTQQQLLLRSRRDGRRLPFAPGGASRPSGVGQSSRGATWLLDIWDEALPAVGPAPRAAAAAPGTGVEPANRGIRAKCGAAVATAAQMTTATAASPAAAIEGLYLVDLGVWRGHKLLAARVVLLVPKEPQMCTSEAAATGAVNWVMELQQLLEAHPPDEAQQVVVDVGLLLSGALHAASGVPAAGEVRGQAAAGAGGSGQRLLVLLDLGCNLLSLALKWGACALAEQLWGYLERLGFSAEEVLLHAAGIISDMPPLHAAVLSGTAQTVSLVLRWYHAARLQVPWLQPVGVNGGPPVLTPLVLASASSLSGSLLLDILRHHPQALAAWSISVNGASARSAAAAAGLWHVVWVADILAAASPAATAAGRFVSAWRRIFWGPTARLRAGAAASRGGAVHDAGSQAPAEVPKALRRAPAGRTYLMPAGKGVQTAPGIRYDLDMFVAQRTRLQRLILQSTIVAFQTLAHIKALVTAFDVACPTAAAVAAASGAGQTAFHGWSWLLVVFATGRCVAWRYWWTVVEVATAAAITSPLGTRHYTLSCVAAAVMRCMFQAWEGELLPPSRMSAEGGLMALTSCLFVLLTACSYQPSLGVNIILRVMEGLAASRMYLKYGVTAKNHVAIVLGLLVNLSGLPLSAVLRSRAEQVLRKQWQHFKVSPQQYSGSSSGGHEGGCAGVSATATVEEKHGAAPTAAHGAVQHGNVALRVATC